LQLYVYWHWYWHVESLWSSARRLRRGETLTKSERRPFRKATETLSGISPYTGGGIPSTFSMANGGGGTLTANAKSPQSPTLVTNANNSSSNGHLVSGKYSRLLNYLHSNSFQKIHLIILSSFLMNFPEFLYFPHFFG
jgi:hypothetical protein